MKVEPLITMWTLPWPLVERAPPVSEAGPVAELEGGGKDS